MTYRRFARISASLGVPAASKRVIRRDPRPFSDRPTEEQHEVEAVAAGLRAALLEDAGGGPGADPAAAAASSGRLRRTRRRPTS